MQKYFTPCSVIVIALSEGVLAVSQLQNHKKIIRQCKSTRAKIWLSDIEDVMALRISKWPWTCIQ